MARTESHQRAIDQAAILFPYLSVEERMEWWDRLQPVNLTELTIHMKDHPKEVTSCSNR
jgi:hypothetical protein